MEKVTLPGGLEVSRLCLGAMALGTAQDEKTSYAILDRFVAAGGTFLDTANNYMFWYEGCNGDESEKFLSRWLSDRDNRDAVVIGTKVGYRPAFEGGGLENLESLSRERIRQSMDESLARLGTDRVDVFWTHRDDRDTAQFETVAALGELVAEGRTRTLGASNHATWRVERARGIARASGAAPYNLMQLRYSYLHPRPDTKLPQGGHVHATTDAIDYATAENIPLLTYNALLDGSYTRADKPLPPIYDHPGTTARLKVLDEVAAETDATRNQVVLAWLTGHAATVIPLVGVSSVSQLDEVIDGVALRLSPEQWQRLTDAA